MFLLSLILEWHEHKQVHPIMLVQKFGMKNHIVLNVIFGHSDAFFMKWQLLGLHLFQVTWEIWKRWSLLEQ